MIYISAVDFGMQLERDCNRLQQHGHAAEARGHCAHQVNPTCFPTLFRLCVRTRISKEQEQFTFQQQTFGVERDRNSLQAATTLPQGRCVHASCRPKQDSCKTPFYFYYCDPCNCLVFPALFRAKQNWFTGAPSESGSIAPTQLFFPCVFSGYRISLSIFLQFIHFLAKIV